MAHLLTNPQENALSLAKSIIIYLGDFSTPPFLPFVLCCKNKCKCVMESWMLVMQLTRPNIHNVVQVFVVLLLVAL